MNPEKRYVRFRFDGYAPVEKAAPVHLCGRATIINELGEDLDPYQEED